MRAIGVPLEPKTDEERRLKISMLKAVAMKREIESCVRHLLLPKRDQPAYYQEWYHSRGGKAKMNKKCAARYEAVKAKVAEDGRQQRARWKHDAITHYGGKCAECGEADVDALVLDHINNDGAVHRLQTGGSGWRTYRWCTKNNFPPMFQVLCHNHNAKKEFDRSPVRIGWRGGERRRRVEAILRLGGRCAVCSETDIAMLQLDHLQGGGRESLRNGAGSTFRQFVSNPIGFQVLCANHNYKKHLRTTLALCCKHLPVG